MFLSGLKKDNSKLVILEKYKTQKRLIISKIESKFKNSTKELFSDELLKENLRGLSKDVKAVGVNFPLTEPPCMGCKLRCPGVEACKVTEVKWLVREYKNKNKLTLESKKEVKIPAPYIERSLDFYLSYKLEKSFPFEPTFGASKVGLYSRGLFLRKNFKKLNFIEVSTKVSLWRLGKKLKLRKSVLENFYKSENASENRELFLKKLSKDFFLYDEDLEFLVKSKASFEALLCALSAYEFENKGCEKLPLYLKGGRELKFALPELKS